MNWNPLNTLTGRMVLVTVLAVILSYAVAFAIYANERGAALRRAAETGVIERVVFTVERLREVPQDRQAAVADSIRDFSMRYRISASADVAQNDAGGPGGRIARGIAERLEHTDVRAQARTVEGPSRRWRSIDRVVNGDHGSGGLGRVRRGRLRVGLLAAEPADHEAVEYRKMAAMVAPSPPSP